MKTYTRLGLLALLYFILTAPFTWYLIRSWGLPATGMIVSSLKDPDEIVNMRRALGPIVSWVLLCATLGGTFNFLLIRKLTDAFLYSALIGMGLGILFFDFGAAWALASSLFQDLPFNHETPNICMLVGSGFGFIVGLFRIFEKSPE